MCILQKAENDVIRNETLQSGVNMDMMPSGAVPDDYRRVNVRFWDSNHVFQYLTKDYPIDITIGQFRRDIASMAGFDDVLIPHSDFTAILTGDDGKEKESDFSPRCICKEIRYAYVRVE